MIFISQRLNEGEPISTNASAWNHAMSKSACLFIVLFVLALATNVRANKLIIGKVVGVTDGDTITVLENHTPYKIRLYGIDCPERRQDFGNKAKQFVAGLVFGKRVRVVKKDVDRYGRTVGIVFVGKTDVDEDLVKNGLAWVYLHYCKIWVCSRWLELESQAQAEKIGLWAQSNPMPPWEFRRINRRRRHYW